MKQAFVYTMQELCMLVLSDLADRGKVKEKVNYKINYKAEIDPKARKIVGGITFTVEENEAGDWKFMDESPS